MSEIESYLEKQLVFYGSYHHNKINILTHVICVPLIFWSIEVGISKLGFNIGSVPFLGYEFLLNPASLIALAYSIYYVILDPIAGILFTPLWLLLSQHAVRFSTHNYNSGNVALIIQILAWIAQFLSHGLAEKRAPALFDGLVQAFTLAPLFVFLEVLFYLGYKPELNKKINLMASKNISTYRASLQSKEKNK